MGPHFIQEIKIERNIKNATGQENRQLKIDGKNW